MLHTCLLNPRRLVLVAISSLLLTGAAMAEGFTPLSGNWSGGGTVNFSNGNTEKLRCRASYNVASGGVSAVQNLNCASASTNVNIVSNVALNGSAVVGNWTESTRGVSGQVNGRLTGSNIAASISGPGFNATLGIGTNGKSQNITINVSGGDVSTVAINLSKN